MIPGVNSSTITLPQRPLHDNVIYERKRTERNLRYRGNWLMPTMARLGLAGAWSTKSPPTIWVVPPAIWVIPLTIWVIPRSCPLFDVIDNVF